MGFFNFLGGGLLHLIILVYSSATTNKPMLLFRICFMYLGTVKRALLLVKVYLGIYSLWKDE